MHTHIHTDVQIESSTTGQPKPSRASPTVLDESTGVPSSAAAATGGGDNPYDYVEWKANTKHESAAQSEEIELSTNAAYGTVQ